MLESEKWVSKFPATIVGSFMAASTEAAGVLRNRLDQTIRAATPWRVAMASDSASAWTVQAEIRLVASFTTVAAPTWPQ